MKWAGEMKCRRCDGAGCYFCNKKGHILACPTCGDIDSQEVDGKEIKCLVCGTAYQRDGSVIHDDQDPDEIY